MKQVIRVLLILCITFLGGFSPRLNAASLEDVLQTKVLTETELMGKSSAELALMRNHIYARHGYIFKKADLKKHFSGFDWYKPTVSDSAAIENKLSATEKRNIDLLQKLEKKPLTAGTKISAPSASCGQFIDDESNIRAEPAVKGKLLGVSKTGETFEVLENKDPWILLKTAGGLTGWSHKKNLKLGICPPARTEQVETPNSPQDATPAKSDERSSRHVTAVEVDLNIDRAPEKVELEPYESTGGEDIEETFYHLKVSRRKGSEWETLWVDEKNENPFYIGHAGVETLQVVQDFDADGKVEILSACAQSDVSPTLYRLFRWNGAQFNLVKKALLASDKETPTEFIWTDSKDDNTHIKCWVLYFDENQMGGGLTAFITSTFKDQYKSGKAILKHSAKGFTVDRWLEPLKAQ